MAARGRASAAEVAARLMDGGFVAAEEEAEELLAAAAGDGEKLEAMLARRLTGEPLAWITGTAPFCGLSIKRRPRRLRSALADRGARPPSRRGAARRRHRDRPLHRLRSDRGEAESRRPNARVVATDIDERAVACARSNGVEAYRGRSVRRSAGSRPTSSPRSCRTCRRRICRCAARHVHVRGDAVLRRRAGRHRHPAPRDRRGAALPAPAGRCCSSSAATRRRRSVSIGVSESWMRKATCEASAAGRRTWRSATTVPSIGPRL